MAKKPTYQELEARVQQLEHEVSQRRLAEQELSIFQRLAETAGYGFGIADADGKINYINHSLCRMLGEARPEDAYGKEVSTYYSEVDKEELVNTILPAVFNDGQWVGRLDLQSIEGKETPTIQNIFIVRGERERSAFLANLIIDISDRQRLHKALRGSRATLESIFRAAPIGIGLVSNRIIKQVNDRILEMTGYDRDALLERSARILYPNDEEFEYVGREKYSQIGKYGTGTVETRWKCKNGKVIDVLMSSTPLVSPHDLSAGVTFTAMDITDRKRAEAAQRKSEEEARRISIELALGLSEVFEGLTAISFGDPSIRISETSTLDSITKLKKMVNQAAKDLGEIVGLSHEFAMGLTEHFDVLYRVSKGDLAARVRGTSEVELLEYFKKVTNQMIESVAVAMADQKRAEEGLRKAYEQLEQKVTQRTADLTETNELLLVHRKKLRSLAAQLSLAEEKERRRIATEVHDQIGQNLAFAKMKLGEIRTSTSLGDHSDTVRDIIELIDGTIQDTRSLVSELGSPILYELGLVPAVEWLAQQAQNKHKFQTAFKDDGRTKPVTDEVQVFLFQAVRESLANVAKHAEATHCTVSLKVQDETIRVDVEDNGIGFEGETVGIDPEKGTGFGFFSIRERLEPLGGILEIHSKPGQGTRLTLFAPLRQTVSRHEVSELGYK